MTRFRRMGSAGYLALALALSTSTPAAAYRQVKIGPLEIAPSLALEVNQHSNVYLTNDDDKAKGKTADAGLLLDLRPGLNISARPNLEKRIRGFYVDLRYSPTLTLFPNAPIITLPDSPLAGQTPDHFKIDHNVHVGLRYQASGRLSFSGGVALGQPELSKANFSLTSLDYNGGLKYDFSRTMSIQAKVHLNQFTTPKDESKNSELGTFDELSTEADFRWRWRPTLTFGASYRRAERLFANTDFDDLNHDNIPDSSKDYLSQSLQVTAWKRLARQVTGSVYGVQTWRSSTDRQFGSSNNNRLTGGLTVETLLTRRTRLQATLETTLTDTLRLISFPELNAFTGDQIGQFSVIPEQFATVHSRRLLIDLIQNVFRRGDQILFGVAVQRDDLFDQQGSQNFFVPRDQVGENPALSDKRPLDGSECEVAADPEPDPLTGLPRGARFCRTVLNDQEQKRFLITAGYRVRLLKWLGLQLRGSYFNGDDLLKKTYESNQVKPDPVRTSYWSVNGGMVVNLSVFK